MATQSEEALLVEAHGRALRLVCARAGRHFQGLASAGRALRLPARVSKKLIRVDVATAYLRHATRPMVESFLQELDAAMDTTVGPDSAIGHRVAVQGTGQGDAEVPAEVPAKDGAAAGAVAPLRPPQQQQQRREQHQQAMEVNEEGRGGDAPTTAGFLAPQQPPRQRQQ